MRDKNMENGVWRIRKSNDDLQQFYDKPEILNEMKIARIRQTGNLQRLTEEKMPTRILQDRPCRRRPKRRPM